jgi:hypothetical protein
MARKLTRPGSIIFRVEVITVGFKLNYSIICNLVKPIITVYLLMTSKKITIKLN